MRSENLLIELRNISPRTQSGQLRLDETPAASDMTLVINGLKLFYNPMPKLS